MSDTHGTISSAKDTVFKIFTTQPPPTSTMHGRDTPQVKYYNHTMKSDDGILQYLPVDILKSVHHTLQSQPASLEGKIHFLKTFEKTLMSEIGRVHLAARRIINGMMIRFREFPLFFSINRISSYYYYDAKSKDEGRGSSQLR